MQAILFSSDTTNACYSLSSLNAETAYSITTKESQYLDWDTGSSSLFSDITVAISRNSPSIYDLNFG